MAILLALSGCIFDNNGLGPLYDKLVGEWLVDLNTRPAGWLDTKYVFGSDGTFEIYYDTDVHLTGDVVEVTDQSISVVGTEPPSEELMVMCYILGNGDTAMELGWYIDGTPVYYLDFTKQ